MCKRTGKYVVSYDSSLLGFVLGDVQFAVNLHDDGALLH